MRGIILLALGGSFALALVVSQALPPETGRAPAASRAGPRGLTLLGWAQVAKAFVYFVFPAWGLRGMARVSRERPRDFVYGGVVALALAGVLGYHLLRS